MGVSPLFRTHGRDARATPNRVWRTAMTLFETLYHPRLPKRAVFFFGSRLSRWWCRWRRRVVVLQQQARRQRTIDDHRNSPNDPKALSFSVPCLAESDQPMPDQGLSNDYTPGDQGEGDTHWLTFFPRSPEQEGREEISPRKEQPQQGILHGEAPGGRANARLRARGSSRCGRGRRVSRARQRRRRWARPS